MGGTGLRVFGVVVFFWGCGVSLKIGVRVSPRVLERVEATSDF